MFDPTIYDNLKVVLEGELYDRDLAGSIVISNRSDLIDLARMSRAFQLAFRLRDSLHHQVTVSLSATTQELFGEIMEVEDASTGCHLAMTFHSQLVIGNQQDWINQCGVIRLKLEAIWGSAVRMKQALVASLQADGQPDAYECQTDCVFIRKITEEQINDLPSLVDSIVESLIQLNAISAQK